MSEMFDTLSDYVNLYDAAEDAFAKIKNKRNPVIRFRCHLGDNVLDLRENLLNNNYELTQFRTFVVYDPKERRIRSLAIRDRVVQRAIYNQILNLFEKRFIKDTYACLKFKGCDAARKRLSYFINKYSGKKCYYLKLDVSKYFYSINTSILYDRYLKNLPSDVLSLMKKFVPDNQIGVPIGDLLCQLYANLYLSSIDHFCKFTLRIKHYIRYMDDIIILSDDINELREEEILITKELNKLDLRKNPKSHINSLDNGIPFIGYNFYRNKIYAKSKKVGRMRSELDRFLHDQTTIAKLNDGIASRYGTYKHAANNYIYFDELNKIDAINKEIGYESKFIEKIKKADEFRRFQCQAISWKYIPEERKLRST